jgi:hypothetical protein
MSQLKIVNDNDPPPLDPNREALRLAIANVAQCNSAIDDVRAAQARLQSREIDASRRVENARKALEQAQSDGQANRLEYLMGRKVEDAHRLEGLRRELDAAIAEESALAIDDEDILKAELARVSESLRIFQVLRTNAIAEVLRPVALRLVDRIRALRQEAANLHKALDSFPPGALDDDLISFRHLNPEGEYTVADQVAHVIAQLTQDADAIVPEL